jgi:isopentenyl-diphosphate Delta-isomerase
MEERVILVDNADREIGVGKKTQVHLRGDLHRAFSVFVFDSQDRMLLQRRSGMKYHSRGLWSNAWCGHPRPGENTADAARRRLVEEMGFDCDLRKSFAFLYKVRMENGLFEHEYDHVFIGKFSGQPVPTAEEIQDWKWVDTSRLREDLNRDCSEYTYWFTKSIFTVLRLVGKRRLSL